MIRARILRAPIISGSDLIHASVHLSLWYPIPKESQPVPAQPLLWKLYPSLTLLYDTNTLSTCFRPTPGIDSPRHNWQWSLVLHSRPPHTQCLYAHASPTLSLQYWSPWIRCRASPHRWPFPVHTERYVKINYLSDFDWSDSSTVDRTILFRRGKT